MTDEKGATSGGGDPAFNCDRADHRDSFVDRPARPVTAGLIGLDDWARVDREAVVDGWW
jgi:hypothetical protein